MIGDPSSIAIRPGTGRFFLLGRVNASIRSIELFWPMIGDPSSIAIRPGTGRFFLLGRANASELFHLCQIRASIRSLF